MMKVECMISTRDTSRIEGEIIITQEGSQIVLGLVLHDGTKHPSQR